MFIWGLNPIGVGQFPVWTLTYAGHFPAAG